MLCVTCILPWPITMELTVMLILKYSMFNACHCYNHNINNTNKKYNKYDNKNNNNVQFLFYNNKHIGQTLYNTDRQIFY